MRMRFQVLLWLACGALLGAAACSDGSGPGATFDASRTSQTTEAVTSSFQRNQAVQSMDALGDDMAVAAPPAVASQTARDPGLASLERATLSSAAMAPIFPADALGKTFICQYNDTTKKCKYVIDPNRTGAPATGVRFILYAVDPLLRRVLIPLQEIGYVDITDKSTPAQATVGIKAVVNNATVLEYDASSVVTTTSVSFAAVGYLMDGAQKINFDLSQGLARDSLGADYKITVEGKNQSLRFAFKGVKRAGENGIKVDAGELTLTINDAGHTTELKATASNNVIEGTVTYDGEVVIKISGAANSPTFTDKDGNPLSEAELAHLRKIFEFVESVVKHFGHLLRPAYRTLIINVFDGGN